jgi:tetratricopeptide (TPR) repeat protein
MKRFLVFALILSGCSILTPLQKTKFITVSNLIETSKFIEAKAVIDEMIEDNESSKWARTWYTKGLLCQTAHQEGIKKNDNSLVELYPDQLYLAYESYQKSLLLDNEGRMERLIAPKYVTLANEFQGMGEKNFTGKKYVEALRAFEQAILVTQSPILSVKIDTNLVYNTALAAYESKNWDKAMLYLNQLHKLNYSVNATHLLFCATLEKGDTISAKSVLADGIIKYANNEELVLLYTDILFKDNDVDGALKVINEAIIRNPSNSTLHYTKGLVYQKYERYNDAINSYKEAAKLTPDNTLVILNLATCYYNIGVEIEENTKKITNNRLVQEEKTKSAAAFEQAVSWLDKIYEKGINDQNSAVKVYELYKLLRISDKAKSIETLIR